MRGLEYRETIMLKRFRWGGREGDGADMIDTPALHYIVLGASLRLQVCT